MISNGNDINHIPFVSTDCSCVLCTASYFFVWKMVTCHFNLYV